MLLAVLAGSVVIDASSASFERGTTGDLRNGVAVEVRGTWRVAKSSPTVFALNASRVLHRSTAPDRELHHQQP